jgi:SAM-dependent methyltransferase
VAHKDLARLVKARVRTTLWKLAACAEPDVRTRLALRYLRGDGIEIGALHGKLPVPRSTRVRYLDRLTVPALREQYPELDGLRLVAPDIIDDDEVLGSLRDGSLDFVAASHFIEHCQNPIGTIRNHLSKLREAGVLFLVVPDKRATFDAPRAVTSLDHLIRADREGASWSRRSHYEEWVREAQGVGEGADEVVERLLAQDYSIHFHVWTPESFEAFLAHCRSEHDLRFEVAALVENDFEFLVILRRGGVTDE